MDAQQLLIDAALKELFTAGSHGRLQRHLFDTVGRKKSKKTLIETMRVVEDAGFATKESSNRGTSRWGYLWRITDHGKRHHLERIAAVARELAEVQEAVSA